MGIPLSNNIGAAFAVSDDDALGQVNLTPANVESISLLSAMMRTEPYLANIFVLV